ncbi:MAG: IS1 family transposase [Roseivirga sp.]
MELLCTHCGSHQYYKNGAYKGSQRYKCKKCQRFFSDKPRRFFYQDKKKALDMYLNNVGIRKIARFMQCSPPLVLKWIKEFSQHVKQQLSQAAQHTEEKIPDIIEMDEIYTFVKKKNIAPWYGLLILESRVVLLRM